MTPIPSSKNKTPNTPIDTNSKLSMIFSYFPGDRIPPFFSPKRAGTPDDISLDPAPWRDIFISKIWDF